MGSRVRVTQAAPTPQNRTCSGAAAAFEFREGLRGFRDVAVDCSEADETFRRSLLGRILQSCGILHFLPHLENGRFPIFSSRTAGAKFEPLLVGQDVLKIRFSHFDVRLEV